MTNSIVSEYEVFKNESNALAFFFYKTPLLDGDGQGPFRFAIEGDTIRAGTADHHAIFPDVTQDVIDIAQSRGVIMLVEFENQQPVRCHPCYLTDEF